MAKEIFNPSEIKTKPTDPSKLIVPLDFHFKKILERKQQGLATPQEIAWLEKWSPKNRG